MPIPKLIVSLSVVGTAVGVTVLWKDLSSGARYTGEERMAGKTVVITGANSGIGKETALDLAERGGRIIMACRNMEKCKAVQKEIIEATYNRNVHCKHLNLGSIKSIRSFAEDINQNEKRVDVLINNAGVMRCPKMFTEDGFELQLGVNHLGPFLLTNLLLDKLKSCEPSRIIWVAAAPAMTRGKINFDDLNSARNYDSEAAFYQSQLAVMHAVRHLAQSLKDSKSKVTVNAVYPGTCKTNIGRYMDMNKSKISGPILNPIWWLFMRSANTGAQSSIYCACEPLIEKESGHFFMDCVKTQNYTLHKLNNLTTIRMWAVSEYWTGLKDLPESEGGDGSDSSVTDLKSASEQKS